MSSRDNGTPPDPGDRQSIDSGMVVGEGDITAAEGRLEEAQKAYFSANPRDPGSFHARKQAESQMAYAKQQLGETRFHHQEYEEEKFRVEEHNRAVATADRDHDGIPDEQEIKQQEQQNMITTGVVVCAVAAYGVQGLGPGAAFGILGAYTMAKGFSALAREPSEPEAEPMTMGPAAMFNGHSTPDPMGKNMPGVNGPNADAEVSTTPAELAAETDPAPEVEPAAEASAQLDDQSPEGAMPAVTAARRMQPRPSMGMSYTPKPPTNSGMGGMG